MWDAMFRKFTQTVEEKSSAKRNGLDISFEFHYSNTSPHMRNLTCKRNQICGSSCSRNVLKLCKKNRLLKGMVLI